MNGESVTAATWRIGRARGLDNKEIRANWKDLYQEAYNAKVGYAQQGIKAIINELQAGIDSYSKYPATKAAEEISLANIKTVIQEAIDSAGWVPVFEVLSKIYQEEDDWLTRITAAIYDQELAQWSQGMPQYTARLQSELIDKLNNIDGVDIDVNSLDLQDIYEEGNENGYINTFQEPSTPMDVDKLIGLLNI